MEKKPYIICTIIFFICLVISLGFFISSFKIIGFNQTGMLQNKFTKEIFSDQIYKNGRYLVGPFKQYI